ncbi:HPr kinase/phosphorylase [Paracoccus jeotgali]|uniref:Serine kinase n=1 Tax=Paracoccus jeotgali TaxID=2065379 RepID=A0A2K9MFP4_9RHOB|nr:serine kinase [Paracoccus jeotgali]AUM74424.1 serine kinase [Paracoccus jeotgali]
MAALQTIHGTAVSLDGQGVLILGSSGSGKSALALSLMGLGGVLVADDRVVLNPTPDGLITRAPEVLAGLIEARGVGLLRTDHVAAPIRLVVDLGQTETQRLPPIRHITIAATRLPLVLGPLTAHLPMAIRLLLRGGRVDPEGHAQAKG